MIPKQRRPVTDDDGQPYPPETLTAAIAGDREAFGVIWAAHRDDVLRAASHRLRGPGAHQLVLDITSETCLRAMEHIGTLTELRGGGVPAWLCTIARNLIMDHFKSSRHRREFAGGELLEAGGPWETVAVAASPEDDVLAQMTNTALRQAVERLNDAQRQCVTLRFLAGLSAAETAEAMGKLEGAVKTMQFRAVRTLARDQALMKAITA
ncbi:MAG TPA: sigma-70 family RNA polymerase sigma factor [Nocardioides sp.]|nr:sigma-70 family RNA polymerase sigma factor [Nocardioides sp.]